MERDVLFASLSQESEEGETVPRRTGGHLHRESQMVGSQSDGPLNIHIYIYVIFRRGINQSWQLRHHFGSGAGLLLIGRL